MVIMFHGTEKSKNNAPHALAMCAAISATTFSQKTLVLQLMVKHPIEELLVGSRIKDGKIKALEYEFDDTGIDSLLRRESQKLTKEHFDNSSIPILKSENLLDVVYRSKLEGFETEIVNKIEEVEKIIASAKEIYDNIFVMVNGKTPEFVEKMLPLVDSSVICVPQGNAEVVHGVSGNVYFLVTDFDRNSIYNVRYMKKMYNGKSINIMPYDAAFKDAYNTGRLMQFALSNYKTAETDVNHFFIKEMVKFTRNLLDGATEILPNLTFRRQERKIQEINKQRKLRETDVVEKIGKRKLFEKKAPVYKTIDFGDELDVPEVKEEEHIDLTLTEEVLIPQKEKKSFFKKKRAVKNVEALPVETVFEKNSEFEEIPEEIVYEEKPELEIPEEITSTGEKMGTTEKTQKTEPKVKKTKATDATDEVISEKEVPKKKPVSKKKTTKKPEEVPEKKDSEEKKPAKDKEKKGKETKGKDKISKSEKKDKKKPAEEKKQDEKVKKAK